MMHTHPTTLPQQSWMAMCNELTRLSTPGVIGFYDRFEITEVVAFRDGSAPLNIFSLFVAEDGAPIAHELQPIWLNEGRRIKVKGLADWTFGVARYAIPVGSLPAVLNDYASTSTWKPSGKALLVGPLKPLPPQFMPPDSSHEFAWNRVLKNNFWNGSHVFELADPDKRPLMPFFDHPERLKDLSEKISKYVPFGIGGLSDRLGNILIQFPVTVLVAKFRCRRQSDAFYLDMAWDSRAPARPLRTTCEIVFDGLISAYSSAEVSSTSTDLPMHQQYGEHRGHLWDDANNILLAATAPSGFVSALSFNIRVNEPEPREFYLHGPNGQLERERIGVVTNTGTNTVGSPSDDGNGGWTERRLYTDEVARLTSQRRFVQYGPQNAPAAVECARALQDIRALIAQHGDNGAWLWDPYLCADDVLKTLFYCPHGAVELRALTGGKSAPSEKPRQGPARCWLRRRLSSFFGKPRHAMQPNLGWSEIQKNRLEVAKGNLYGLRLEFRIKTGHKGWAFHDRFLIFPKPAGGALAWSLGTSVNSLGHAHHILQKVADGQMVADAFTALWDALDEPEHVVWKMP